MLTARSLIVRDSIEMGFKDAYSALAVVQGLIIVYGVADRIMVRVYPLLQVGFQEVACD